jgi:hypothetical protein
LLSTISTELTFFPAGGGKRRDELARVDVERGERSARLERNVRESVIATGRSTRSRCATALLRQSLRSWLGRVGGARARRAQPCDEGRGKVCKGACTIRALHLTGEMKCHQSDLSRSGVWGTGATQHRGRRSIRPLPPQGQEPEKCAGGKHLAP